MTLPFTGGCVCCHCRDCQRVSGGGHVAGFLVPVAAFRLTQGELRYHFTPSLAGGQHKRGFCPECASRLTGAESAEQPRDFIGVTAGSLDDSSWFQPKMELFTCDAQPWDPPAPKLPQYEQYPPR